MRVPFVSRRRYDDDLAAARAEAARLREQRDTARNDEETARFNRERILHQLAAADAANRRLSGRNLELGARLAQYAEADPEYAASLEARLKRALRAAVRYRSDLREEKRRADTAQNSLDVFLGLDHPAVAAGASWQDRREQKMRYDA
ncbi:hypothetical protein [Streptomyces sp. FL07-04A]|uniref:hypothetical protein n=1 Tax=Streptomyces sp. FL07-04A TaxID=3028658 RepID=UPI0029B1BC85|nr:hypothetical protein [Streptomyces sp. FL07-04A]MDX3575927.1 hypothetical protein [Streptomyces sp. FL07-04A]